MPANRPDGNVSKAVQPENVRINVVTFAHFAKTFPEMSVSDVHPLNVLFNPVVDTVEGNTSAPTDFNEVHALKQLAKLAFLTVMNPNSPSGTDLRDVQPKNIDDKLLSLAAAPLNISDGRDSRDSQP